MKLAQSVSLDFLHGRDNTDTLTKSHKGAKAAASGEERAWKWRVAKDGPACSMTVHSRKQVEKKNSAQKVGTQKVCKNKGCQGEK